LLVSLLLLLLLLLGACTFQGTKRPSLKLSVQQLNQHVLLS
jgi:outer membrane lipoprotein-sorting protein